jgi:glucose/arabinose dehydrogenase
MKKIITLLFAAIAANTIIAQAVDPTISLPQGFKVVKIAEGLGTARHIAISPKGQVYVKLNYGRRSKYQKGILYLQDLNKDGIVDSVNAFGNFSGTGIAIKNGYLYASSDEEVFRYKLDGNDKVMDSAHPEKIITGLISRHEHEAKAITIDNVGNIYVNIGAYSNACQVQDRQKGSPAMKPCPILDSAGGIWQFKVDKLNQTYGDGVRYATGLRNVVGLDWNTSTNSLFVMQHGRDQLHDLFPDLYDTKQSAELPAETMYELHKGSNCGWPYIYYDHLVGKKIIAPEYGGDGKKSTDEYQSPAIAFPGHLAPNGLLFYTGNQFPEKYKNGAFIAFHGSWNRAPEPQEGYYVVFVPFKNGKPTGQWEVFANGFSGKNKIENTRQADHRPCGLAQDVNGNLYVTDDSKGTIYKISYNK